MFCTSQKNIQYAHDKKIEIQIEEELRIEKVCKNNICALSEGFKRCISYKRREGFVIQRLNPALRGYYNDYDANENHERWLNEYDKENNEMDFVFKELWADIKYRDDMKIMELVTENTMLCKDILSIIGAYLDITVVEDD